MVDVISIPYRFKYSVSKPEHQYILDGFFAEIMVDAIYLRLIETFVDFSVQFDSSLQTGAKWFFHDQLWLVLRAGFGAAG